MKVYRFIAERLQKKEKGVAGEKKLSRVSTGIGLFSVAISITVILIAISVVSGFRSEIRSKASGFMGAIVLTPPGQPALNCKYPTSDSVSFFPQILDIKEVESIHGVVYSSGVLKNDDNIYGAFFKGVDSLYNFSFFESSLVEGKLPDYSGKISNDILISRRMADRMNYKVGDNMVAYFIGDEVKVRKFKVCGIYDAQLEDIDNTLTLIDRRQAQRINGWSKSEFSTFEINLKRNSDIEKTSDKIEQIIFDKQQEKDPPLFVSSVLQLFSNLFDWLNLLDFNMMIVMILMLAVAGFNMISTLLIILFEKISMIGVLKSLGMTNAGVNKVFRRVAFGIVGKGLIYGNIAALVLCVIQKYFKIITLNPENYFVKFVPVRINFGYFVAADLLSVVIIMAIMMLSSFFISKISPDRTMRVE